MGDDAAARAFAGLFDPLLAATPAPPPERLPALKMALCSESRVRRRIGLKAVRAALPDRRGSRTIGAEYSGIRPTASQWHPTTYKELFDSYRQVWRLMETIARDWDDADRTEANSVLIQSASEMGLIRGLADETLSTLGKLATDDATDLTELVETLSFLRRCADTVEPTILQRIDDLDGQMTGRTLSERLRRTLCLSSWSERAESDTFHETIAALVRDAVQKEPELKETVFMLGGI